MIDSLTGSLFFLPISSYSSTGTNVVEYFESTSAVVVAALRSVDDIPASRSNDSGYAMPEAPGAAWSYNDYAIQLYQKTLFDKVFKEDAKAAAERSTRRGGLQLEDRLGLMLHVVHQEQENDQLLDAGELGPHRRVRFRGRMDRGLRHLASTAGQASGYRV